MSHEESLDLILQSYDALASLDSHWVTNLSNCSSLLYSYYSKRNINWAGFYILDNKKGKDELFLGPFMGKVACQLIKVGTGVCGVAALKLQTQLVNDVDQFPGHIACDGETKSEIVVPIIQNGQCVAVLDLDCTHLNGFNDIDKKLLEQLALKISETCNFSI